jgi:replicative DNA helicase
MAVAQRPGSDRPRRRAEGPQLLDRQPPCNLEAERAVLGSILLKPDVCDDVVLLVRADDFYDEAHQKLFAHMLALHEEGRRVDLTLLVDRLKTSGDLEAIGGYAALAEIGNSVPTAANAQYYAGIVRDKSTYRALIHVGTEIVHDAYDQADDSTLLLSQAEQKIFSILEHRGLGQQADLKDVLHDVMDRIDARMKGEHVAGGLETHFADYDALTGGLHDSELIILAARPSMGKTALALNIAEHVARKASAPVLFVSLEMSRLELGDRLLCSFARVNGQRLRNGTISNEERRTLVEKAAELSQCPLFVDDTPTRTVTEIAAVARRLKRKHGLRLVVIDYLQLIEPDNPKDQRQEQVARIARRLKHLARDLSLPVLCLAQLNRQAEMSRESKPRLSHLRESGAIEQDADVVMFVHREEYYATSEDEKARVAGEAELIVAKQRNGPIGEVKLTFLHKFARFEDATQRPYDEFGPGDF